jgi:hypothetical protein
MEAFILKLDERGADSRGGIDWKGGGNARQALPQSAMLPGLCRHVPIPVVCDFGG